MKTPIYVLSCLLLYGYVAALNAGERCRTPEGENGRCIRLGECSDYSILLTGETVPTGIVNLLRKARCGLTSDNKPLLCCPGGVTEPAEYKSETVEKLEGYERLPGIGRYKLHKIKKNFPNAANMCWDEGAHLAIINSEEEADALLRLMKRNGVDAAWIGVYDLLRKREFRTIFGTLLNETGYSKWLTGEPNGRDGKEFCVEFHSGGGFNDYFCQYEGNFICEVKNQFFWEYVLS